MKTPGLVEQIALLNGLIDNGPVGIAQAKGIEDAIRKAQPAARFPSVSYPVELLKFRTNHPELLAMKKILN